VEGGQTQAGTTGGLSARGPSVSSLTRERPAPPCPAGTPQWGVGSGPGGAEDPAALGCERKCQEHGVLGDGAGEVIKGFLWLSLYMGHRLEGFCVCVCVLEKKL
jgi:hypothetical protein